MPTKHDLRRPEHLERDVLDELLHPLHRVPEVGVGLVPLEHRELGLVLVRDALVAEVLPDLVHLLQPAHDQPLQVQLGRDAQVEVRVELVVVRDERPREGAAVAGLEHRRLDLDEAALVEPAPDRRHHAERVMKAARVSSFTSEVEVALAVARLGVLQPVVDVGQRPLDLGEEDQLVHGEGWLPTPRSGGCADRSDDVAEVDVDRARAILGAEQLDAPRPVHEVEERELAVAAPSEHPTGDTPARLGFLTRLEALRLGPYRGDLVAVGKSLRRRSRHGRAYRGAGALGASRHDVIMTLDRRHIDVIMTSWN